MGAKILVSDTLSEAGLEVLNKAPGMAVEYKPGLKEAELAAAIPGFDALVIRSGSKVTAKVIAAAKDLKVIGRAGIGVDNVDVAAASKHGIIVMNTPTGNAVTTAEHAIALLMALARKIPQATASMRAGKWEKSKFQGHELSAKTLGVIGLGNIGRVVADRARGLHMSVIGYDPVMTPERAAELGIELVSLEDIWSRADAITVHTPLTTETRGLVNETTIGKMKSGVLLVNCARGGIYDEAALVKGLESKKIGGVALDVFTEEPPGPLPILGREDVICTPHLGASTEEAQERVALEIAEQVVAYLTSGTIANAVNVPSVSREIAPRLAPYVRLAERLGTFLAQAHKLSPRAIEVECVGEPGELGARAITCAGLAGVLEGSFEEHVNPVSAPHIAKDAGIAVRELKASPKPGGHGALVSVRVEQADGSTVRADGTLFSDGAPRLVRWSNYEIDAHLAGSILVVLNEDRPGVIGAIGTILGRSEINVSRLQVGLEPGSKRAAALWGLDTRPSPDTLSEIQNLPHVAAAMCVRLP
ncbi:MAG: phosphoglycerate dehydrogenase [Polyangiaceae bacterium]